MLQNGVNALHPQLRPWHEAFSAIRPRKTVTGEIEPDDKTVVGRQSLIYISKTFLGLQTAVEAHNPVSRVWIAKGAAMELHALRPVDIVLLVNPDKRGDTS